MGAGTFAPMRILLLSLMLAASPAMSQGVGEAVGAGDELDYVMELMADLQPRSFAVNRELCGYLAFDQNGELTTTRISVGEEGSCYLPSWPTKLLVIASFHTHSTYSAEFDSEYPSVTDMESDEESGIDGYISTPGGRLWFHDSDAQVVHQICGLNCLPQDPNFQPSNEHLVRPSYTYRALVKHEAF